MQFIAVNRQKSDVQKGISVYLWNGLLEKLLHGASKDFLEYIAQNPYPTANVMPFEAQHQKLSTAASAALIEHGFPEKDVTHSILLSKSNESESLCRERERAIVALSSAEQLGLKEFVRICSKGFIDGIQVRKNAISIYRRDKSVAEIYPPLNFVAPHSLVFQIGDSKSEDQRSELMISYLCALKFLILHPLVDGNGRCARMIISAGVMRALRLNSPLYVDPFFLVRKSEIAAAIAWYRRTGCFDRFLFAVSAVVRDSLVRAAEV
jgi:hypothetical protein